MIDFEDLEEPRRKLILNTLAYEADMLRKHYRTDMPSLIHDLQRLLQDYQARLAKQGIHFPQMAVLPLPSVGTVDFWRRDLDRRAIQQQVMNICTKYPAVDMLELAVAVKAAYPGFKPEPVARARAT